MFVYFQSNLRKYQTFCHFSDLCNILDHYLFNIFFPRIVCLLSLFFILDVKRHKTISPVSTRCTCSSCHVRHSSARVPGPQSKNVQMYYLPKIETMKHFNKNTNPFEEDANCYEETVLFYEKAIKEQKNKRCKYYHQNNRSNPEIREYIPRMFYYGGGDGDVRHNVSMRTDGDSNMDDGEGGKTKRSLWSLWRKKKKNSSLEESFAIEQEEVNGSHNWRVKFNGFFRSVCSCTSVDSS